jgi:hypothetical protein
VINISINKYSIPTEYRGITFRSKLEASWAEFFDDYDISWVYETVGYDLPLRIGKHSDDTIRYLPDFYLPDLESFFEVKGVMEHIDLLKLSSLWWAFSFPYDTKENDNKYKIFVGGLKVGVEVVGLCNSLKHESTSNVECAFHAYCLAQCHECYKHYFVHQSWRWDCPHCGREGDGLELFHIDESFEYAEKLSVLFDEAELIEEDIARYDAIPSHPNGTMEEKLKEFHRRFSY